MYYIHEEDIVFCRCYGWVIYAWCDVPGIEENEVTIFLAVTLIQKTPQVNGVKVMHPKKVVIVIECGILVKKMSCDYMFLYVSCFSCKNNSILQDNIIFFMLYNKKILCLFYCSFLDFSPQATLKVPNVFENHIWTCPLSVSVSENFQKSGLWSFPTNVAGAYWSKYLK